jgi:hypothetical protein
MMQSSAGQQMQMQHQANGWADTWSGTGGTRFCSVIVGISCMQGDCRIMWVLCSARRRRRPRR